MNTSAKKFFSLLPAAGGLLVLACFLAPSPAFAGRPLIEDYGTVSYTSSSPSESNINVNADGILVYTYTANGVTPFVEFNGDNFSQVAQNCRVGAGCLTAFYLDAPDAGTYELQIVWGSGNMGASWIAFENTQGTPFDLTYAETASTNLLITNSNGSVAADELEIAASSCTNPVTITIEEGNSKLLQFGDGYYGDVAIAQGANAGTRFRNGAISCSMDAMTFRLLEDPPVAERCDLLLATGAVLPTGEATIYAEGTCEGFYPTTAWLGAVRIDPIGYHVNWSEGLGPFTDPYSLSTTDATPKPLPNGTYRVRMYGKDGDTLYVSEYYQDVVIDDTLTGFRTLTVHGIPLDEWTLDPNESTLSASTTGAGYTFSASAAAIAAAGGLGITADGCAAIGEDATSTTCVMTGSTNLLRDTFPLLTWPMGILSAFHAANAAVEDAPTDYALELPSHGDWIPAVIVVDSASRTKGIGAYIPVSVQDFFREVLAFGIWVAFVLRLKAYADEMIGRGNPSHTPGHV